MALKVGELYAILRIDDKEFHRSIDQARSKFKQLGDVAGKIGTFFGISMPFAMGAAGAAAIKVATSTADLVEKLDNMAATTGLNITQLQEFKGISDEMGLSFDGMANAATMLTRKLMGIEQDTGNASKVIQDLGIDIHGAGGELRSMSDLFPDIIARLQGMSNETTRNTYASQIFGRGMSDIAPILNLTGTEMDALKKRMHDSGLVMGDETVAAARNLDAAMDELKTRMVGVKNTLAGEFMPALTNLVKGLDDSLKTDKIKSWGDTFKLVMTGVGTTVQAVVMLTAGVATAIMGVGIALMDLGKITIGGKLGKEGFADLKLLPETMMGSMEKTWDQIDLFRDKGGSKQPPKPPVAPGTSGDNSAQKAANDKAREARKAEAERKKADAEAAHRSWVEMTLRHLDEIGKLDLQKREAMRGAGPREKAMIERNYLDQIAMKRVEMAKAAAEKEAEALTKSRAVWESNAQAYERMLTNRTAMTGQAFGAERQDAFNTANQQIRSLSELALKKEDVTMRMWAVYSDYQRKTMDIDKQQADAKARTLKEQADAQAEVTRKAEEAEGKRLTMMQKLYVTAVGLTQGETAAKIEGLNQERDARISEAQKTLTDQTQLAYAMAVIDADTQSQQRALFQSGKQSQAQKSKPTMAPLSWLSSGADVWKGALEASVKASVTQKVETHDPEVSRRLESIERLLAAQNTDSRSSGGFGRIAAQGV